MGLPKVLLFHSFIVGSSYLVFDVILQEMLPKHIHMRVAESILFAGKAVRVLRNPSAGFQFQDQQITKGS